MKTKNKRIQWIYIVLFLAAAVLIGFSVYSLTNSSQPPATESPSPEPSSADPSAPLTEWTNGLISFSYPENYCTIREVGDGEKFQLEITGQNTSDVVPRIDLQQIEGTAAAPSEEEFSQFAVAVLQYYFEGSADESHFEMESVNITAEISQASIHIEAFGSAPAMEAQVTLTGGDGESLLSVLILPDAFEQVDTWKQIYSSVSLN